MSKINLTGPREPVDLAPIEVHATMMLAENVPSDPAHLERIRRNPPGAIRIAAVVAATSVMVALVVWLVS